MLMACSPASVFTRGAESLSAPRCQPGRSGPQTFWETCCRLGVVVEDDALSVHARQLPGGDAFDVANCFGNSFGSFDDAGHLALLRAVARALKPGATFVLNTGLAAESLLPHLLTNAWTQVGPIWSLARRQDDPVQGVLRADYTFLRDGTAETRSACSRVCCLRELR